MTLAPALLSSGSQEWETPADLFKELDAKHRFTLDPCSTPKNAKAPQYFTKVDDGLSLPWHGRVFMNPPYGRKIGEWVAKARAEVEVNAEIVVCLLPARTDTRWWHDHCAKADEIHFIKGRLKFSNAKHNAPFPCVLVTFKRKARAFKPERKRVEKQALF